MRTLIDFGGDIGRLVPYSVYQVELTRSGKPEIKREVFVPHEGQRAFFTSTARYTLLAGNRGCGKSAALLWKAIFTAHLIPGSRIAIFRRTLPELLKSIWDVLLGLPKDLFQDINLSTHTATVAAKDRDGVKLSKIWFLSAANVEDARKALGFELNLLLLDEWCEIPPELWRFLSGSVRSPLVTDIAGRPAPAQICGASTPGGQGSEALKALFIDGRSALGEDRASYRREEYRFIKASIDQNPLSSNPL